MAYCLKRLASISPPQALVSNEMNINDLFDQDQLPTVPAVAMRILKLVDDPRASSADLASEIKNDSAMAAQLLRLANSPAFCPAREITSVELAVSVLGRTTVASTALTFSLCQHVESDGSLKGEFDNYWRSTVLQAVAAELLGGSDIPLASEYFLIGLLADIGRLALLCILKKDYAKLARRARRQNVPLYELEEQTYGFSHVTVSCRLAREWGLPDSVIDGIRTQHTCVSDLLGDDIEVKNAVAPIASIVADLFTEAAIPNAAVSLDGLAGGFFSTTTEELLQKTRRRMKELGHVFDVDVDSLPPVVEIMNNANRRLAELLMQQDAAGIPELNHASRNDSDSDANIGSCDTAPALTREEFEQCAAGYLKRSVELGFLPGMLLVQCHTADECRSCEDEDVFVRSVRQIIQESLRTRDLVTRLDSHYICVLCSLLQADELNQMARRLLVSIQEAHPRKAATPVSIGGIAMSSEFSTSISQLQQMAFFRLDSARQNDASGIDIAVFPSPGSYDVNQDSIGLLT